MGPMTVVERSSRGKILDVREQRRLAMPLEFREDRDGGHFILEGYASTFMPYDCYGGVERGGWVEEIDRGAFRKTLNEGRSGNVPDVQLLLNHEGLPLARTTSGTLELTADNRGLKVRALLDKSDPDVQRIAPKMKRGDLNEMSFAFRVKDQVWNNDYSHRLITEVSLQRGDVSIVSYGMNPDTKATLSEEAISALARMSEDELMELRNIDGGQVRKALNVLSQVVRADDSESGGYSPPAGVRAEAKRALAWIKEGHAGSGFTDVGRGRASDLAAGRSVSRETIGRIANYLARHEGDKKGEGWSPGDKGYPSPGRVAWAAWGGDPAKPWTAGILKSDSGEEKSAVDAPFSVPAVGVTGPKRSDPKPNTQFAKIVDGGSTETDPSDQAGSAIQAGIADQPSIIKTGESASPVKMEIDPAEASPLQMTLIAALQSTISNAHSVAMSNNDSARALIADAVEQIEKIQSAFTVGESPVERQLRELREAGGDSDEEDDDPSDKDTPDDDEEPDDKKPAEEDGGEWRDEEYVPGEGEPLVVVERSKDKEDDEDEEEEEEERSAFSIDAALREIRREKGVPEIHSVSEGLAYLRENRK